ncbi:MAG: DeoR/GlpR transcriptional regulator [Spirochaetales bacterium]|nr:DeoR/GlpR transcriptional regulator [Spirochaetales bacterium]
MLAEQRREKIVELVRENGNVRVSYISKLFNISEPTARQDLIKIETETAGEIARDHGGAYLKNTSDRIKTLSLEHTENMDLKQKIGAKAASFIKNHSSITLDSGTTVTEMAKCMTEMRDLRIITNSLNIALTLGANPNLEIHMTGGEFKSPTLSLTGDKAAIFFENMHVDQLFLAAAGVTIGKGLTYPGFSDLPVKQAMIDSAEEVYLLVDSTKINHPSFAALNVLNSINYMITDSGISESDRKAFEEIGIKIIIA